MMQIEVCSALVGSVIGFVIGGLLVGWCMSTSWFREYHKMLNDNIRVMRNMEESYYKLADEVRKANGN